MNSSKQPAYLRVALASPLRTLFDYRVPAAMADTKLLPGQRVTVPFGNRQLTGFIVEISRTTDFPDEKVKEIAGLIDEHPVLDPSLVSLYQWASDYYHHPVGLCFQAGLPRLVRAGNPLVIDRPMLWRATPQGIAVDPDSLKRAKKQQRVLDTLRKHPDQSRQSLAEVIGSDCSAALSALESRGLVERITARIDREVFEPQSPLTLNEQQKSVLHKMSCELETFNCHLLEGVTGSGKTEIYLQLIDKMLARDRQVLILVPEIGLTPQTVARFEKRFGFPVTVVHSGLTESARFRAWIEARSGKARIIIGTRSAIFMPLKTPGMIIIDEEHDPSFKQQDGFRYSARDIAIYRARQLDIPVVLGSATPSLETLNNALRGRYLHHILSYRTGTATLPDMQFVDLRGETLHEGLTESLLSEIRHTLDRGEQALVFLNRRGYSPLMLCHDCGWVAECSRCNMAFTLHQRPSALICHHCDKQASIPASCPHCTSGNLQPVGMGTERIEQTLIEHFPGFPVVRVDRDTTRTRQSLHDKLALINENRPCILIGTQMLAKGHHFPEVTLAAILDVDRSLFTTAFRGQEQLGQLVTQVAGRAGRGSNRGKVLIQTHHCNHPVLQTLATEGYGVLARQLLEERLERRMPPAIFMALVHADSNQRHLPEQLLGQLGDYLGARDTGIRTLGPLPSPLEKKAGRFRFQLHLHSANRLKLQSGIRLLVKHLETLPLARKVRWSVDIDPLDFS